MKKRVAKKVIDNIEQSRLAYRSSTLERALKNKAWNKRRFADLEPMGCGCWDGIDLSVDYGHSLVSMEGQALTPEILKEAASRMLLAGTPEVDPDMKLAFQRALAQQGASHHMPVMILQESDHILTADGLKISREALMDQISQGLRDGTIEVVSYPEVPGAK